MIARLGNFCFRRRWWVLVVWLVIAAAGLGSAGPLFASLAANRAPQGTESDVALQALADGRDHGARLVALVDGVAAGSAPTGRAVRAALDDVRAIKGVKHVHEPQAASDGRGLALTVDLDKMDYQTGDAVMDRAAERLRALTRELPGAAVSIGGQDMIDRQTDETSQSDLTTAEMFALPLTLVVLVFVFGGIAAATLPVLGAVVTILGAFAGVLAFTAFVEMDTTVISVVSLMGLGLSIDYGLLLVARYRQELAAGHAPGQAVARTWATAGRTILFSALTVIATLSGLMFFDVPRLQTLGVAGMTSTLVALLTALTLTGALLGVFSRRIKPSRRHRAGRPGRGTDSGFFAGLARFTQRRPGMVALAATAILLAVAAPLLTVRVAQPNLAGLPPDLESVRVAKELGTRYGQAVDPAVMVVSRADGKTLAAWAAKWRDDPAVSHVRPVVAEGPGLTSVVLDTRDSSQSQAAQDLVGRVRADRPPGGASWVAGEAAVLIDLVGETAADLPKAVLVTVVAVFVLLFLMTGSLLVPLSALVLTLLSLAATFGVMTLLFQHGWLAGPLDTLTLPGLSPYVFLVVFVFAFAFSTDYEVFLLGRIKEAVDDGADNDTAVRRGLQVNGRVITCAALLMLIVFACFGTAKLSDIEQLGIGLFVAVLIDATIVRCLLVPAVMTLSGKANWWAPRPLRRFHARFGLRESQDDPRVLTRT
ncbi:MMPL family transporter [Nonomuraea sp. FMUSA5-5]|uniref:MMPL family transporter n=1 Tax=Nonomuraea composti TaxID=2720023 RepID=A0ABX1BMN5_9ACTN|nr:MMPL family transporter [Nonomuraea sp. FMUSA5-5]NJP96378.1 MMPL family transporter [Nonomuraea sp. FMUSA5-5]